jgi:hypothetical protein
MLTPVQNYASHPSEAFCFFAPHRFRINNLSPQPHPSR